MLYPAQFEEVFDEDVFNDTCGYSTGFVVTFRDVPEANTQGYTLLNAIEMAEDALRTAMEFYDEAGKPRPTPSESQHGDVLIELK